MLTGVGGGGGGELAACTTPSIQSTCCARLGSKGEDAPNFTQKIGNGQWHLEWQADTMLAKSCIPGSSPVPRRTCLTTLMALIYAIKMQTSYKDICGQVYVPCLGANTKVAFKLP